MQHEKPYIEPTEEESRNGWTAESLTDYLEGRIESQAYSGGVRLYPIGPAGKEIRRQFVQPTQRQSNYDPMRW